MIENLPPKTLTAARSVVPTARPSFSPSFLPQEYSDVYQFFGAYGITVPMSEDWRLTERLVGHINALHESYGHLAATNGILCYIERNDGSLYGPGHIAWFITNKGERIHVDRETKKITLSPTPRSHAMKSMIEDLV